MVRSILTVFTVLSIAASSSAYRFTTLSFKTEKQLTRNGACVNEVDKAAVAKEEFKFSYALCNKHNLADPNKTAHCLNQEVGTTQACSSCFGAEAWCGVIKCYTTCVDSHGDTCKKCMKDGCFDELKSCTGFTEEELPPTLIEDMCANAADYKIIKNAYNFTGIYQECAVASLGGEDDTAKCLAKHFKFSEPCSYCFGDEVGCSLKHCFNDCVGGASPACETCVSKNCIDDLKVCTGLSDRDLPGNNKAFFLTKKNSCTNDADRAAIKKSDAQFQDAYTQCAKDNMGQPQGTANCLKDKFGFSQDCTNCFGDELSCTLKNCLGSCMGGPTDDCAQCVTKYCMEDLKDCTGLEEDELPGFKKK